MCKFSHLVIGDLVTLRITGAYCDKCSAIFDRTADMIYHGHETIKSGLFGDFFTYTEQQYCPKCGNPQMGYVEPCQDWSIDLSALIELPIRTLLYQGD